MSAPSRKRPATESADEATTFNLVCSQCGDQQTFSLEHLLIAESKHEGRLVCPSCSHTTLCYKCKSSSLWDGGDNVRCDRCYKPMCQAHCKEYYDPLEEDDDFYEPERLCMRCIKSLASRKSKANA